MENGISNISIAGIVIHSVWISTILSFFYELLLYIFQSLFGKPFAIQ